MPKLYPEDQEKVNQYIQKEGGGDEREPFKPFKLLLVILAALGALTLASFWVAAQHGYV